MIIFKKEEARINLNNSIYSPDIVETAVEDFKDCCKIKLTKGGLSSSVIIKGRKDGLKELAYGFCNYALALMKDKFVGLAHYVKR